MNNEHNNKNNVRAANFRKILKGSVEDRIRIIYGD